MSAAIGWGWFALCALGVVIALLAASNLAVALPAAVIAVVSAGMASANVFYREARTRRRAEGPISMPPLGARQLLASGTWGRTELLVVLDELERGRHAGSLSPSSSVTPELLGARREVFLRYLEDRLARIEATR